MISLSVGEVSAVIAALITILQFFLPSALALLIIGILKDDMTAVSWSSVSATLHGSYWATILRADTTVKTNVESSVKWSLRLGSLGVILIFAASIVTPIGLYDIVEPQTSLQDISFPYVADTGPFGVGTPERSTLGFNHQCGIPTLVPCPGTDTVMVESGDFVGADFPFGYDSRIPAEKIQLFQSGLKDQQQTVSSIFNIEYRSHGKMSDPETNNGSFFQTGAYRQLDSLVLDGTIEAVEGLVVDMIQGRVAFRNHTLPSGVTLGATWEEDLLVMEPETQCVNTNLTIDFTLSGLNGSLGGDMLDMVLTDRGGFANIVQDLPGYDKTQPQVFADLAGRAYQSAWFFNVLLAVYYNVTRPNPDVFGYLESAVGKTFQIPQTTLLDMDAIAISDYADVFSSFLSNDNATFSSDDSFAFWPNPFNITSSNFTQIQQECNGVTALGKSNVSNVAVGCGLLYGVPRLPNGDAKLFYDPGERLSMPLMSCASAVKMSVKTFSFRFNGTEGLGSLHVDAINERSTIAPPLYWGVENNNDFDIDIQDTPPLWGLVSSDTQASPTLSVVKSPHLYLAGYVGPFSFLTSTTADNMPGVNFPVGALTTVYNGDLFSSSVGFGDYSGKTSFSMFAKWQKLAGTTNGTANIVNLIFADVAANALVGTKSWLPSSNSIPGTDGGIQKRQQSPNPAESTAQVPVRVFTKQIRYKWVYGIPAYLSVLITGVVSFATLLLLCFGRTSISKTKAYLNATSPGRVLTLLTYPGECETQTPTSRWVRGVGAKKIRIGRPLYVPNATQSLLYPGNFHSAGHGVAQQGGFNGYETDVDPLIDQKTGMAIQLTPMSSPMPPRPPQGGLGGADHHAVQGQAQAQEYYYPPHQGYLAQFGSNHVAGQLQAQFPRATPS